MIRKHDFTIKSKFDNLTLGITVAVPTNPIGIVQIAHGMSEHRGRYLPFLEFLAKAGYVAVIHDHRGHGESVRSKEDYGYFYPDGWKGIVEDLHQVTKEMKKRYPRLPLYLFSHSMGTLVARNYIQKYDRDLSALILSGPPTKKRGLLAATVLTHSISFFKGDHFRSRLLQRLIFGHYNDRFKTEKISLAWLSTNPENNRRYQEDSQCGFIFTTNGFIQLFRLMKGAFRKKGWQIENPTLPILVLAGEDDPVIQSTDHLKAMIVFLEARGYSNVEKHWYEGKRHELLNEENQEEVKNDILAFLKQR